MESWYAPRMFETDKFYSVAMFRNLRLVDINEFHEREESLELPAFQNLIMRHVDTAKEKLLKKLV